MKYLIVLVLSVSFVSARSQTVGSLISQVTSQDKYLDTVFARFKIAEWKSDSMWTIVWVKRWADSANKYINLSEKYMADGNLDSCIEAIHEANKYIVLSKKRLKLLPD